MKDGGWNLEGVWDCDRRDLYSSALFMLFYDTILSRSASDGLPEYSEWFLYVGVQLDIVKAVLLTDFILFCVVPLILSDMLCLSEICETNIEQFAFHLASDSKNAVAIGS